MVTLVQEVKKEAETLNPSPNPFQDIFRLLKTVEKDSMSDQDVITVFYSISLPLFVITRHDLMTSFRAMGQKLS